MWFLNPLKLRHKLLLLISLPLLLVLGYAYSLCQERYSDLDRARDIQHLARTTELLAIVHWLQFERSKAVIYTVEQQQDTRGELRKAIERTERFSTELPKLKDQLSREGTDTVVIETLASIQTEIRALSGIREQLLDESITLSAKETQAAYNHTIEKIHTAVGRLLNLASGNEIFQLTDALNAISELKEVQGRQRGLVSTILERGAATEADIRQLISMVTKNALLGQKFVRLAPSHFQDQYLRLGFDETGATESNVVNLIISAEAGTPIAVDGGQWSSAASQQIDKLRELEKSINREIQTYAEARRDKAYNAMLTTLGIALTTVAGVLATTLVATGRLTEGFVQLRDSAVDFTNSGELKTVTLDNRDELGEVATAFNRVIEQLRHISQAVEAVASGDFDQQVNVKSERDRFALSLNHMIRTLRESVGAMRQENWLKTGQSELAVQINTDQPVRELAQSALTYLANYLAAPVGAVYLVDNDEVAILCASYAYTFRKETINRFARGESLVGQAVMERVPIVVRELPPDYICVSSGLGSAAPRNVVVIPLIYAKRVLGVLELGTLKPLDQPQLDLLEKAAENLAVSLHAALSRERLAEVLEETQAQAEELQSQQEELEQANAELEEQAQRLEESQQELRTQKQQLTDANEELQQRTAELQGRNRDIERRSEELEKARQALETKARELAAASKYKSEFLANMSHELRTPLNSLLLLAQTLKSNEDGNLTEEQLEALNIVHGSGRDLLGLINDILDLSKVEAGKLRIEKERCDLAEVATLLQQQFGPLAREKQLVFNVELSPSAPAAIFTDPQRLQQILRNLVGNAIKFTESGRVGVTIETTSDNGVCFGVQDTGIGIPVKLQSAIFEAFQQGDGSIRRKYSGTGLGLTISRELAQLLGGCIALQSDENRGSLFRLLLPEQAVALPGVIDTITTAEADHTQAQWSTPADIDTAIAGTLDIPEYLPDDRKTLRKDKDTLLIIEDDLVFARSMLELAHNRGLQCLVAGDGSSGLALAKRYNPDAIVLDMVLPDMNGNQVMEQLKADTSTQHIPVHISSSLDKEDVDVTEAIGLLMKPISQESIDNAFSNILRHINQKEHEKRVGKDLRSREERTILVVEDDTNTRKTIAALLRKRNLRIIDAPTGKEAIRQLEKGGIDCMILDLNLPDMESLTILKRAAGEDVNDKLPVVIYTGKDLSHEEYKKLRQYTDHIIIKGSLAQERLLNDVTLFLHSLQSRSRRPTTPGKAVDSNVLKGKKVLIVDDDMRNTFALANLLRRYGMNVVMADNGGMALEKLAEMNDIDITIMDIMMPVMDGYEAIRRIRELADYKNLPIIAVTAKAMPEDRDKCLRVGANDYLAKPVDSERLVSTLKVWASA